MKTKISLFILIVSFLLVSCQEKREYLYFGEDGYTQYHVIGDDSVRYILYNNGFNPYYIGTITKFTDYSFFEYTFLLKHDSFAYKEMRVNPGDTLILKKDEEITHRWKYVDECGHPIPFYDIHYVGYWEDGKFHKE